MLSDERLVQGGLGVTPTISDGVVSPGFPLCFHSLEVRQQTKAVRLAAPGPDGPGHVLRVPQVFTTLPLQVRLQEVGRNRLLQALALF